MDGFEAWLCEQVCLHRHFMTENRDSQISLREISEIVLEKIDK